MGTNTYTVVDFAEDGLLYSAKDEYDKNYYYVAEFAQDGSVKINTPKKLVSTENISTTIMLCLNGTAVYKNSESGLTYINQNGDKLVLLDGEKLTPLCVVNNYIYAYDSDSSIYKIDFAGNNGTKVYDTTAKIDEEDDESETWKKPYFEAGRNISVNGNNVYFYVEYSGDEDSAYYLNRVKTSSANKEAKLVGVLLEKHIKTPEEDEE